MPKKEVSLNILEDYLPPGCLEDVLQYLNFYKVQLTVTKQRASILGDYRHAHHGQTHRISVNGNLNKYSFLITLLHELAHLFAFERYGPRVQAHGIQWKKEYADILSLFLSKKIFPVDIENVLMETLKNPAASSCGDDKLLRVLHRYDKKKEGTCFVENIEQDGLFKIRGERIFCKGEKIRTRYKCIEVQTGKCYLFSGVHEVTIL